MKANPMLEEIWKIKDDLALEAGHDTHRFFENLRKWAAEHPHPGPRVRNAEELHQLPAEMEGRRAVEAAMILNDKPMLKP